MDLVYKRKVMVLLLLHKKRAILIKKQILGMMNIFSNHNKWKQTFEGFHDHAKEHLDLTLVVAYTVHTRGDPSWDYHITCVCLPLHGLQYLFFAHVMCRVFLITYCLKTILIGCKGNIWVTWSVFRKVNADLLNHNKTVD